VQTLQEKKEKKAPVRYFFRQPHKTHFHFFADPHVHIKKNERVFSSTLLKYKKINSQNKKSSPEKRGCFRSADKPTFNFDPMKNKNFLILPLLCFRSIHEILQLFWKYQLV